MSKKNRNDNTQKVLPFEKILSTLPECTLFKKNKLYGELCDDDPQKQGFLELLFRILKECSIKGVPNNEAFSNILAPALGNYLGPDLMIHRGIEDGTGSSTNNGQSLAVIVGAIYYGLLNGYDGELTDRAAVSCRYVLLTNLLFKNRKLIAENFYKSLLHPVVITKDNVGDFSFSPNIFTVISHVEFALRHNLKLKAHRIIGYLQAIKSNYEPGDVEYLSALVWLSNDKKEELEEAISELKSIPKSFRYYRDARGMLAEAYAKLGDGDSLVDLIKTDSKIIDVVSMRGYLQLLINNMEFLDASVNQAKADPARYYKSHDKIQEVFDLFYEKYNCSSEIAPAYQLGSLFHFPLQLCQENILAAIKEVWGFYVNAVGAEEGISDGDEILPASLQRAQLLLVLSAEDIANEIKFLLRNNIVENIEQFVEHWFPLNIKDTRDLTLFLGIIRTLTPDDLFTQAFIDNWDMISQCPNTNVVNHWLSEAYFAAITCDHEKREFLHDELVKRNPHFDAISADDIQFRKVYSLLDRKSKLLYAAAQQEFEAALKSSKEQGWQDSGMISLGFFRIVEVEMRTKLLGAAIPRNYSAVKSIDKVLKANDKILTTRADRNRILYAHPTDSGSEQFDLRRLIQSLLKPGDMDLGAMECALTLLSEHCEVDECILPYVQELKELLYNVLSPEGIVALKENRISYVIREEKRKEYRNPPAHARYLPFAKAAECRDYVNKVVLQLHSSWLKKD